MILGRLTNLYAKPWNAWRSVRYARPYLKSGIILDAGAGAGYTSKKIADVTGSKVIACDIIKRISVKLPLIVCDVHHLPFKDNSFNTVLCACVLHHIEGHEQALNEMVRVGERVIVQENVYSNLIQRFLLKLHGWTFSKYYKLYDESNFRSESGWKDLFRKLSLNVVDTRKMIPSPFFPVGHRQFVLEKKNWAVGDSSFPIFH